MVKKIQQEKIVYSYDRLTKEYTGKYKCQKDPLKEGSFLMPANATETEPPTTHRFEVACYINEKWEVRTDYRGQKVIILETQQIQTITDIGSIPDGSALLSNDDERELLEGKKAKLDDDGNLVFFTPPPTKEEQIASLEKELADTDWYVVRHAETGVAIPADITSRRAELRIQISQLKEGE